MSPARQSTTYKSMVNRAKEYIDLHWHENLTLQQMADRVFLSPFHFLRIFKTETGETPKEYLTRLRLEAAVQMVRVDLDKSVYEVAMDCGFSSQSVFARAFRQRYGVSATEFRKLPFSEVAKLAVWEPSIQKVFQAHLDMKLEAREGKRFFDSIQLKRIEPFTVVYLPTSMVSEEHLGDEFQKLLSRAASYDIPVEADEWFGVMYDFPLHTPLKKCRYKVCLPVSDKTVIPPKLFSMKIDGGKYATFPLKGDIETMIQWVIVFFNRWIPKKHYQRSKPYLMERFTAIPDPKTYRARIREIFIPIKPA